VLENLQTTLLGLEPTVFASVGERFIRYATSYQQTERLTYAQKRIIMLHTHYALCCVVLLALDRWPPGTYGIPKPEDGCPLPASQWKSGSERLVFYFPLCCIMTDVDGTKQLQQMHVCS